MEFAGDEIEAVDFADAEPFSADTLRLLVETQPSRCSLLGLPVCIPFTQIGEEEHHLDLETLREDAVRLALFYRRSGFFGTAVRPEVEREANDEDVVVTFRIERGEPVVVETLAVEGTEGILDPDSLERTLPLQPGDRFDLGEFAASADTILGALLARGHAYADVLRNYTVNSEVDQARVSLVAVPGPQVVVDSIIVLGAPNLGREATLRQLTFREGDLLRASDLVDSQRNLYSLELVQLATVSVATDSILQAEAPAPGIVAPVPPGPGLPRTAPRDSTRATVVVRVAETPVHLVEAALGFGTVECFRARARWVDRSFGGGARRLALTGSVSKIGIGAPLDAGLGSVCNAFEKDPFRNLLDYRFAADLTQPYFVSARNHLAMSAYAERQSEPGVFQRVAQGTRLALTRRMAARSFFTGSLDAERRQTRATPALFCLALLVCRPADIEQLSRAPHWDNTLAASWLTDRSEPALDPVDGYRLRAGMDWTAAWLGSASEYLRWTSQGTVYRTVRPEWVLAGHLRLGSFLGTAALEPGAAGFVPPEDRFFAGGASSVRGFERNELGPGIYVSGDDVVVDPVTGFPQPVDTSAIRFFPVGGTSVVVANVELRFPSPFLRDRLRLAAFIDAGEVGTGPVWEIGIGKLRVTPGLGARIQTPIGPVRLDIAYNPYGPPTAPLFVPAAETGELVRIDPAFALAAPSFLDRFRIHLAVGQAF